MTTKMTNISLFKQKSLERAQEIFKSAVRHPSTIAFRNKCRADFGFYDGTGQWLNKDLKILSERNQEPITVNICKGFVDNLSGVEIQSRYRVACRSDSFNPEDDKLAEALTHSLFDIQEEQQIPYKGSLKFRDSLICGIGWGHIGSENGRIFYDYIHPYNIIPDPNDLTPQYTQMKYVCRKIWMSRDDVLSRWPSKTKNVDLSSDFSYYSDVFSPEIFDRGSDFSDAACFSGGSDSGRVLVIEVQYRETCDVFSGISDVGRPFEVFDRDAAEKLASSKEEISKRPGHKLMRTVFFDNTLLEHAPLEFSYPNQMDFSYVPIVFQRRFSDGVPYGLIESTRSIQRDCNARLTKAIYSLNSSRLLFEGNPLPGMSLNDIKKELKSSDSVIALPKDSKFQISNNSQIGMDQLKVVELYLTLMQRVTGIHDEMLGIQTNATSGIAQHTRQINSVRNNVFAFDSLLQMKKREAQLILSVLQNSSIENMIVNVLKSEEKETIILNLTRIVDSKPMIFNNTQNLPVSLYVEEVPDYQSSFAEEKSNFEAILSNGNAQWMMMSPELMKRVGVRNPKAIAKEMAQVMQQKMIAGNQGGPSETVAPAQTESQGFPIPGNTQQGRFG